ncbi:glutamate racemase [Clostridium sp. YIM B02515]|uniref:Glutamate racemase n=1 Tax=Clostridium rhizosphaerae TaxID=2803861 RepID=A0ABS1T640_9CLOT|nr:glutamate racemase [Clostridium rhizosphaerae]MBL4934721.1 glutamate racemase [Clostridium rhizosphaerae]
MSDTLSLNNLPIGFFDSGVGGLSVLKEAIKLLPNEDFIYFGDSKNAPYGTKAVDEVKELTFNAVDFLLSKNVKSIVIACNTATSAAIEDLRTFYKNIPIIGIEPALKPAVELDKDGKIIIMATPMTLIESKFNNLMKSYADTRDIIPLPCAGLVELIERGVVEGNIVNSYLKDKLKPYLSESISSIVLGCTHYPFIKNELEKILSTDTTIIDGSAGTSKQLKRQLENMNALNSSTNKGSIEIINSLNDKSIIELSYKLLNL